MIVVNKRYYDYDYDNNTIIMFDAEDVGLTLDFDIKGYQDDNKTAQGQLKDAQNSQSNKTAPEKLQSQSTETVPDDIIDPKQSTSANNDLDDIKEKEADDDEKEKEKETSDDEDMGNISWISSSSPKGLRRIPYALQVAHSYTINKLEVQLTTLVDTRTIQKQQKQREARAKKLALAQQEAFLKQQQHAEYMAARHHQHGGHRQYPYPHPHAPHARHPGPYPHPHPQYAHSRHGPHPGPHPAYPHGPPQRHPHPHPHPAYPHPMPHGAHPPPPHGYHANGQRKQVAPTSPSGARGYHGAGHRQNPQYYTTNTNHAVQQQNKSK